MWKISRQNRIASTFEWLEVITDGSLTRRPKRFFRCLLIEVPWQINEQEPRALRHESNMLRDALEGQIEGKRLRGIETDVFGHDKEYYRKTDNYLSIKLWALLGTFLSFNGPVGWQNTQRRYFHTKTKTAEKGGGERILGAPLLGAPKYCEFNL